MKKRKEKKSEREREIETDERKEKKKEIFYKFRARESGRVKLPTYEINVPRVFI